MFLSRFINWKKHLLLNSLNVFQVLISASDILMFNIKEFDDDNDDENATFINNFVKTFIIAWSNFKKDVNSSYKMRTS